MKLYKGFDKDFRCRGYQFEEGETYEEEDASLCSRGFHACENPLDVLNHYPLLDEDGNLNRFAEVDLEATTETNESDSKRVGKRISIKAEIGLKGLIKASIEYLKETITNSSDKNAASGDYSQLAASGYGSQLAASGDGSKLAASGDGSKLAASGDYSQLAASGNSSQLAASGDYSQLAASGDRSQLAASGDRSRLAASGDYSQLAASGNYSQLAASGYDSVVMNAGIDGKAKAAKGCWITLAEWKRNGDKYIPACVKTELVDGEIIKANTWYKLEGGIFVEC